MTSYTRLLNACSELFGVCRPSLQQRARRWAAKQSSQVAGERCHMLTRSRAAWPRFCVRAPGGLVWRPFPGGRTAGLKKEDLTIDWFSSLALAWIPRFRRPRSSHWLRGHAGHASIFLQTSWMSRCLCRGLSQLWTVFSALCSLGGRGVNCRVDVKDISWLRVAFVFGRLTETFHF